ncbi:peptidylprolyl isomerase [Ferruginibacter sp. HRS2-29]|uniref:peptidylprolyl isomerase n=1 Tax=Ferruginibacter sp. HRS2-29 TaxID=2487334 RepID=UPI0020CD7C23|nr:peptidylprolyl isomerase [Ferruginibacter sp. HRS2-29]MCP9752919.1 hypothetical protein [Ferruginibacter sp. HRS2-29]
MKKLYIMFVASACIGSASAQTLITYGNSTVSKDEFWRAYNKNKPVVTDKEKSVREYLELYTNFKLKVKAAQDLRIDTLQQIQYDVQNFRNQVTENYLSDDKGFKRLQDEAFDRSQKDIHAIHFSVPVDTAHPEIALKAITELQAELKAGKTNYAELSKTASEKYGVVKQNDLGFITAFSVPYEYENIIYNTKPGEVSAPYRSRSGWHLFKVLEQKPGAGKWKVAQILFVFPPDAGAEVKAQVKRKADSVYALLSNEKINFAAAAKTYSDDKLTYLTEGELPEFGSGKYSYDFESEIFRLKKDGEISKPFATAYGYHIVKRLAQKPVVTDKADETNQFELKQKIMADARINVEREKFTTEIINRTGIKKTKLVSDADLWRYADTMLKDFSIERADQQPISRKKVVTFADGSALTGSDWLKFVRSYRSSEQNAGETNQQLWNKFISFSAVDYYKSHLEKYNEDFKFQMQEFREGNMLFEVMERNVWNKAVTDAPGLQKYYAEHKENYKWAPSADIIVFNCSTEKAAQEALAAMKAGKDWKKIAEESNATIQTDSGRYELTQIIAAEYTSKVEDGAYSLIAPGGDGTAAFVKYLHIYPANMQRSFEEARGLVINDYQGVLEKNWLQVLRAKYPVKVNEAVLKDLLK